MISSVACFQTIEACKQEEQKNSSKDQFGPWQRSFPACLCAYHEACSVIFE